MSYSPELKNTIIAEDIKKLDTYFTANDWPMDRARITGHIVGYGRTKLFISMMNNKKFLNYNAWNSLIRFNKVETVKQIALANQLTHPHRVLLVYQAMSDNNYEILKYILDDPHTSPDIFARTMLSPTITFGSLCWKLTDNIKSLLVQSKTLVDHNFQLMSDDIKEQYRICVAHTKKRQIT